jgi:hypothetical protein
MIACTFLLGLVHDGNDPNTTFYSCLGHTVGSTATLSINDMSTDWKQVVGKVNKSCFLLGLLVLEKALP